MTEEKEVGEMPGMDRVHSLTEALTAQSEKVQDQWQFIADNISFDINAGHNVACHFSRGGRYWEGGGLTAGDEGHIRSINTEVFMQSLENPIPVGDKDWLLILRNNPNAEGAGLVVRVPREEAEGAGLGIAYSTMDQHGKDPNILFGEVQKAGSEFVDALGSLEGAREQIMSSLSNLGVREELME